jgi:hypothetical protein
VWQNAGVFPYLRLNVAKTALWASAPNYDKVCDKAMVLPVKLLVLLAYASDRIPIQPNTPAVRNLVLCLQVFN